MGQYLASLYVSVLVVALVTVGAAGVAVWRRRPSRETTALAVLLAGVSIWLGGTLAQVLASDYATTLRVAQATYLGIVTVPPAFFVFAVAFTGRGQWLRRGTLLAIAVEPIVFLVAVMHRPDFVWASVSRGDTLSGIVKVATPVFWGHVLYAYAFIAAGSLLLVAFMFRSRSVYAKQVFAILPGIAAPWLANVLFLSGVVSTDLTPVAFAVTGIALTWAVQETAFVDLTPVARDAVVDHIGHAVFVIDEQGRLIDVNPAGEAMLRIDGTAIGTPLGDLLGEYRSLLDEVVDGAGDHDRIVVDGPEGEAVYDVDVTELTDYRDRHRGYLLVVHDVTERRRRERELERQNEQLDRFASVVSHDLRTPLTVVKGYVELARENVDEPALEKASDGVDQMSRRIEDLLSLARQGREIEETELVSLAAVAREAWANVETADAELLVTEDVTVQADRSRLVQALENLFRNAVEHGSTSPRQAGDSEAGSASGSRTQSDDAVEHGSTSPGSQTREDAVEHGSPTSRNPEDVVEQCPSASEADGRCAPGKNGATGTGTDPVDGGGAPAAGVTVEVGPIDDGGFYVQDDGPGIPEPSCESVFEYGYTSAADGTGLGLAIVDAIAEAHGWDLGLGDEGSGARFEFRDVGVGGGEARFVDPDE